MNILEQLFSAQLTVFDQHILWREIIGNGFGFASAIGGLRRRVWAWPAGIIGNLLLFTVFFGVAFANPQHTTLFGQAGRQVFFIVTSVYGWWRWQQARRELAPGAPAITPRWAGARERLAFLAVWALGVVAVQQVFFWFGAGWPAPRWYYWCDAWIFVGSVVATYAMARGWHDFWLAWLAVDAVGVPLLIKSHFYPSAVLYLVYGGLVLYGFTVWLRSAERPAPRPTPLDQPATA
ncbi:nicotinamide riboside transporter PnuC [Catellatospora bangladeshensis]|uniref:Nicotinamide mononucleotide transporter n=1 Tax=Catellatospora bangladeshensis TaxID=310355 RepID=A0A8J3JHK7_9ACTN|nr:nicotinamide mononucleotide transporter family protein [Catellatospora bangladeshensis]GIF85007.1 nicotinamide mononucleotide transporter [Catellatospora bangladeshensis]